MTSTSTPPTAIIEEVEELFCGPRALHGRYRLSESDRGEVVIPDTLFRFKLLDQDDHAFALQLYKGINSIGGALWTREVRALLRVSARSHPGLPAIVGGAYVDTHDLAFVLTEAAQYRLSDEGAMAFVAAEPARALRHLILLAHGLSVLHEQGITHRNLSPAAIEYVEQGPALSDGGRGEVPFVLRLSRFEMSAMVSNLVRRQIAGEQLSVGDLRRIYLEASHDALVYCPPERAMWMFGGDELGAFIEGDRSDIYSLGVLAWRWLVAASSAQHPSYKEDRLVLEPNLESIRKANQHLRARLQDTKIPRSLADLLRSMLAWDPRDRPSIHSVVRDLTQDYGRLVSSFADAEERAIYYVGYMPAESKKTIYQWGWIEQDPERDEGHEELRAFLEAELRGAEILYSADGFEGYKRPNDERERKAYRAAKYVLVGKQAYWFCDTYFEPRPAYARGAEERVEELLLIKYVRHHHRAWRLAETPLRRRVPGEMRLMPVWRGRTFDTAELRAKATSWTPLLKSVEFERDTPEWIKGMDDALSFLLAFRKAELDARVFPYEVQERNGEVFEITIDQARDRKYQYEDALRSLYFREMRTPMGQLFVCLDDESTSSLTLYEDREGRPDYRGGPYARAIFQRRLDDDTVSIRPMSRGERVPLRGWIRPSEDQGSHAQLRRQEDAVQELLRARSLLHHLHAPTSIRGIRDRWVGVGDQLAGRSGDIVKDMLTNEPFYGLHGPPGTGKTTVAAVAVAAHLRSDPSQRVLISSQSHYALDNLALRVLKECHDESLDVVAVRVASPHAIAEDKVHPRVARLLADAQASRKVDEIRSTARHALEVGQLPDGRELDDGLKALIADWSEQAPRVELEIRERIRRGANLVFATTGGCTAQNLVVSETSGSYDWVIVEEAARAWPTEIALPLVRGLRWTLIGDHFQLSAFDELSIERFLGLCRESEDEDLVAHGESAGLYMDTFRIFGNLFDKRAERRAKRPPSSRLVEPLDELDLQFRMHPDICRIVARAFYRERVDPSDGTMRTYEEGWLRTHESTTKVAHALVQPRFLANRAVVWLDTEGVENTNDQRAWRNEGEAYVIRALLEDMRPVPAAAGPTDHDGLVLLSPYRAQLAELDGIGLPEWARGRLHTVDSFQGREADIVVLSLVRSTQRDDSRPEPNIGYLVSANRVNVMFSRAKKLLVVVGRLAHFEQQVALHPNRSDIAFWQKIADEVRRQKAVVRAATWLAGGRQ